MSTNTQAQANGQEVYFETADHSHEHHEPGTYLGFWIYLMSDCIVFACFFAAYAVLGQNFAGGPTHKELFDIHDILISTFMLLFSSITYGFAMIGMQKNDIKSTFLWLVITGLFGLGFLYMEVNEFTHLVSEGATLSTSAAWSSFFTLVGTHGLHVTFGVIWLVVLLIQLKQRGLTPENKRRLICLSMFWHFLDLIWVGVFSFVYLIGVL